MTPIHFSKRQLTDLDFSLEREIIMANISGAYCNTTLVSCNTRKYHGLLVSRQKNLGNDPYVLLSGMDETIIKPGIEIPLGTHLYPDTCYPEGYRYIEKFSYDYGPKWVIKAGPIEIVKELLMAEEEARIMMRYTVVESDMNFHMRFNPFTSFRNIHTVSKYNMDVNDKIGRVDNGIHLNMYSGFTDLFLQFSKKTEFMHQPDWHYNTEYIREKERGYAYLEDVYCPGHFLLSLKKGDQFVFNAGLNEMSSRKMKSLFESRLKHVIRLSTFKNCLENSAQQFFVKDENGLEVMAGYPWFGQWGRDTFIALPGLTLDTGHAEKCKLVLDTMLKNLKFGLFPNMGKGADAAYNTADASLWFVWALQQYAKHTKSQSKIWDEYGDVMTSILQNYRQGTLHHIHMKDNGLLYAGEPGAAVTWMDAIVDGNPVTPRIGMTVELNALWYNAICFAIEVAGIAEDVDFVDEWTPYTELIKASFKTTFWSSDKGYLADYVNGDAADWSIRPNQIFAASLPYSPLDTEILESMLGVVGKELVTPRGLRTLSPDDREYIGVYFGNQRERDRAYHQGTVWPWLLSHYAEAMLNVHGEDAMSMVQSMYDNFASAVLEYGLGTIAEIYDGDAPHHPRGAVSQAWSVAALLHISALAKGTVRKGLKKADKFQQAQQSI